MPTTKTTNLAAATETAQTALTDLEHEQAALPAQRAAAVRAGDGPNALACQHRADDLPLLIACARVSVLQAELDHARATMPGLTEPIAAAAAAWNEAKAAHDAALNGTATGTTGRMGPRRTVDPAAVGHARVDLDTATTEVRRLDAQKREQTEHLALLEHDIQQAINETVTENEQYPLVRSRLHALRPAS